MIRLEMKNYDSVSTEKQQKYHQLKLDKLKKYEEKTKRRGLK